MKPDKNNFSRIIPATKYSIQGIKYSWNNEIAFKQEMILFCFLFPAAFFVGNSTVETAILILCLFIVLIAELLNSGLEAIVDKTTPENHTLAGAAKDCGSAAVFFSIIVTTIVWGMVIFTNFF